MSNPLRFVPKGTKSTTITTQTRNKDKRLKRSKPNKKHSALSRILEALAHNPTKNLI